MPSIVEFDGKGNSRILQLFDYNLPLIDVTVWLEQPLFNKKITIKKLIKSVADKESVHSDKEYDETLRFTRSIKLVDEDIHIQHIIALGEYILKFMEYAIEQNSDLQSANK